MSTNMSHEPAAMTLSADGSLSAKDITWTGWGTTTAIGGGLAEADNCKPDCASGTFSPYPITLTLTRPEAWGSDMAYASVAYKIPALHDHFDFNRDLVPTAAAPVASAPVMEK